MTTNTNSVLATNLDAALAAIEAGSVMLATTVYPVLGGSFVRDTVKTGERKGAPYLKGKVLGWDGTQFNGEKIINVYFPANEAGFEAMQFLTEEADSNTIYMVAGRCAEVENDANDSIRLELSDAEMCVFDAKGSFEVGDVASISGDAGAVVTLPIKRTYSLGMAQLATREATPRRRTEGIKAVAAAQKAQTQQDRLAAIMARKGIVAPTAEQASVEDFAEEFETEPAMA